MHTNYSQINWSYLFALSLGTAFGVVIAFLGFFVLMSVLGGAGYCLADLIMTLTFGSIVALAQGSTLKRYGQRSTWWTAATLLGFLIAGPLVLRFGGNFGPVITNGLGAALALGGIQGLAQWFVLQTGINKAPLWIAISLLSWLAAGLIGMALMSLSWEAGPVLYWLGLFTSGIILSSGGLMWLLSRAKSAQATRKA